MQWSRSASLPTLLTGAGSQTTAALAHVRLNKGRCAMHEGSDLLSPVQLARERTSALLRPQSCREGGGK